MTTTYVFPFASQPSIEQMASHNLLIADVSGDSPGMLVHNMDIPPGAPVKVSIIPLEATAEWLIPAVGFSTNALTLTASRAASNGVFRVYIERVAPPSL